MRVSGPSLLCVRGKRIGETLCRKCKRSLDRTAIREHQKKRDGRLEQVTEELRWLRNQFTQLRDCVVPGLTSELLCQRKSDSQSRQPRLSEPARTVERDL